MLLKTSISTFLLITFISFSAHSALITSIDNLLINGTKYDVTFHTGASFNSIFDPDGDMVFGEGDTAIINHAPTFFADIGGAFEAAEVIANALGKADHTSIIGTGPGTPRDGFLVPRGISFGDLFSTGDIAEVLGTEIVSPTIITKLVRAAPTAPIATFELSQTSQVSAPSSIALTGLAVLLLGAMWRRQRVI